LGTEDVGFPPGHDRAELVFELGRFLAEWSQILGGSAPSPARVAELHRISSEFQSRSRSLGFGGIAHHLAQCSALLESPRDHAVNAKLGEAFENVSQLVWQAKQELTGAEQAMVDRFLAARPAHEIPAPSPMSAAAPPAISMAMPPVISAARPPMAGVAVPPAISMPNPPAVARAPAGGFAPPPALTIPPRDGPRPPPAASMPRPVPEGVDNAATLHSQGARLPLSPGPVAPPMAMPRAGAGVDGSPLPEVIAVVYPKEQQGGRASFSMPRPEPQATLNSSPDAGAPQPSPLPQGPAPMAREPMRLDPSPRPPSPGLPSAGLPGLPGPKLLVRSMLGLRAFDRKSGEGEEPSPAVVKEGGAESPLLGFRPMSSVPPPAPEAPPPLLPSRPPPPNLQRSPTPSNLQRAPSRPPRDRFSDTPSERPQVGGDRVVQRRVSARPARAGARRSASNTKSPWWLGAVAALAVLGAAVGMVVLVSRFGRHSAEVSRAPAPSTIAPDAAVAKIAGPTALPESRLLNEDERFRAIVAQMHGRGGQESPELRALLDEQAALQAKLVAQRRCDADPSLCEAWAKARRLLVDPNLQIPAKRRATSAPDQLRSKWLSGLKMPDIPVADDPRVQRFFEYYTENQVGREQFQAMLFRCGAYRDLIQAALIRYDVPPSLLAVVFTESGCQAVANSPVGARGLWQFMPDSGRAYHLRIIKDALDERLSPPKETEAAIRFLNDLYRKFGAWDLSFAAYNMGPFGLMARLQRLEEGGGFWDLADADVLPDETANYVPQIEAFALILANLQKLKFAGAQLRPPEVTSDLDVPPGTRLGLVARAASTSVVEIRSLNLDVIGDRVPAVPGERFAIQVPKDVVWQARDTLAGLIAQSSSEDECVPETFDWGKRRFTPEMATECRQRLATPR
jgi:hypothetical protein